MALRDTSFLRYRNCRLASKYDFRYAIGNGQSDEGRTVHTGNVELTAAAPLAAERLAAHVVGARFAQLPADAIVKAKTFILDTFGVGVAGSRAPFAAELKAQVGRWGAGDEARAWGDRLQLPAASAALVNGFQIHNQEYDCVHEPA